MSSDSGVRVCPVCSYKGLRVSLKLYQINEDEAIYMCTNQQCSYPIGACDPSLVIVKRNVPELQEEHEPITKYTETPHLNHNEVTMATTPVPDQTDEIKNELDMMLEGILSGD